MADSQNPVPPAPTVAPPAPETHADVIRLWPSVAEYAGETAQKPGTARMQLLRGAIPAALWSTVAAAAAKRGFTAVTLSSLAAMARPRKPYAATAGQSEAAPSPIPSAPTVTANA